jgi:hypothetical protein
LAKLRTAALAPHSKPFFTKSLRFKRFFTGGVSSLV